jgi:CheY-like chemotaxis protein
MAKQTPSILIVEDDMVLSMVEARMVERLGYEVAGRVNSGKEAIREVQQQHPDAILMDITLNGSLDGFETMQKIRHIAPIPVIYISGHSTSESQQAAEEVGCADYLVKPIRSEDLKGALANIFQHSFYKKAGNDGIAPLK